MTVYPEGSRDGGFVHPRFSKSVDGLKEASHLFYLGALAGDLPVQFAACQLSLVRTESGDGFKNPRTSPERSQNDILRVLQKVEVVRDFGSA